MRFIACAADAALFVLSAHASDAQTTPGMQQSKFATCAHESKGLRGEEHQRFMSECLKGHSADGAAARKETHRAVDDTTVQQNRMRTCNEEAGRRELHGDERRAFMSSCLKG